MNTVLIQCVLGNDLRLQFRHGELEVGCWLKWALAVVYLRTVLRETLLRLVVGEQITAEAQVSLQAGHQKNVPAVRSVDF
jgi:hypothetical protein